MTIRAALTLSFLASSPVAQALAGPPGALPLASGTPGPAQMDLAGKPLADFPHFHYVRSFNEGEPIRVAFDPETHRELGKKTLPLYLVAHEDLAAHLAGRKFTAAPQIVRLQEGGVRANTFQLDPGTLSGASSPDEQGTYLLGRGYDVVVDVNANEGLDAGDLVDGSLAEPGFFVVEPFAEFRDETTRVTGPYDVSSTLWSGGSGFLLQEVFYPTNIAELGELPVIVISHGNGHNYRWYDHIGLHMASWGYVVTSHANNTGPGIEAASTTTLSNTEAFFGRLEEFAGGALVGHVDVHRIVWMGHSRGGEGVVRAYRRLQLGAPTVTMFELSDVKLVSSIAPTDFLGPNVSDMGAAPYHLWTGGADADVNGCANCDICQTFHLLERADGTRYSTSLHGAGHGDFHDADTSSVANGPCRLGRPRTHAVMRSYLLPLVQYAVQENVACLDYLTRQYEEFRAVGAPDPTLPGNDCVVVDLMFVPGPERERQVVDDFQVNRSRYRSSSDARVIWTDGLERTLAEGRYDDFNFDFGAFGPDVMNGMTLASSGDTSRGAVLEWNGAPEEIVFEIAPGARDLSGWRALSFRAAQSTRDSFTTVELGDLDFSVELIDSALRSSVVRIGVFGGGVEEPYQRGGCGTGLGWANEFETVRVPLEAFRRDGRRIDLSNVVGVGFRFGPGYGSSIGRIGLDEIAFTRD